MTKKEKIKAVAVINSAIAVSKTAEEIRYVAGMIEMAFLMNAVNAGEAHELSEKLKAKL